MERHLLESRPEHKQLTIDHWLAKAVCNLCIGCAPATSTTCNTVNTAKYPHVGALQLLALPRLGHKPACRKGLLHTSAIATLFRTHTAIKLEPKRVWSQRRVSRHRRTRSRKRLLEPQHAQCHSCTGVAVTVDHVQHTSPTVQ